MPEHGPSAIPRKSNAKLGREIVPSPPKEATAPARTRRAGAYQLGQAAAYHGL